MRSFRLSCRYSTLSPRLLLGACGTVRGARMATTAALAWRCLHPAQRVAGRGLRPQPALRCPRLAAHARAAQPRGLQQQHARPRRSVACRAVDPWSVSSEARAAARAAAPATTESANRRRRAWRRSCLPRRCCRTWASCTYSAKLRCACAPALSVARPCDGRAAGPAAHLLRLCVPVGICVRHYSSRYIRCATPCVPALATRLLTKRFHRSQNALRNLACQRRLAAWHCGVVADRDERVDSVGLAPRVHRGCSAPCGQRRGAERREAVARQLATLAVLCVCV